MIKQYLTTFQAAKLLSVTPDSVLKWIKSRQLAAFKTPGGHYRIDRNCIESIKNTFLINEHSKPGNQDKTSQFCWEFYSGNKSHLKCQNCVVYKAQAKRCYEMSALSEEMGYLRLNCKTSCQDCEYFNLTGSEN